MSRPVLAGLVGRSADWLKKIENGDRHLNSLPLLINLARILGVDNISDLTGDLYSAPVTAWSKDIHHVVPGIREAMHDVSFPMRLLDDIKILLAEDLDRWVNNLWLKWHSSPMQRSEVGRALPRLIRQAHVAIRHSEGPARRACQVPAADLYRLVQRLLAHICEPELHALAVERGRALSEAADSPLSLASSAWASSVALCAGGHFSESADLAQRASITLLESSNGKPSSSELGTIGALQLEIAAAHGLGGREGDAFHYLDAAVTTAKSMPASEWHRPSGFNLTNVEIMSVIVNVNLRRNGEAISRARKINLLNSPSVVRRSRLLLEVAQAYFNRREHAAAVRVLGSAMKTSPEAIALIPWARTLADELADQSPRSVKHDAIQMVAAMKKIN